MPFPTYRYHSPYYECCRYLSSVPSDRHFEAPYPEQVPAALPISRSTPTCPLASVIQPRLFFLHAVSLSDAALGLQSAFFKWLPLKFVMWRRCELVVIRDFVPLYVLMHVLLEVHSVLCPRLPSACLASIVEVFSVVWYRLGFIFCKCVSIQRSVVSVLLACWLIDCRRNALWTKQLLPTEKNHDNVISCTISVPNVSTTRQIHSAFPQIVSLTHEHSRSTSVICVLVHGNFTAPIVVCELMASVGLLTKNVSSL